MKFKLLLSVKVLLVFSYVIDAQDYWEQINFPDTNSVFSIAVNEQSEIFIGSGNGVYRTSDDGINWDYLGLDSQSFTSLSISDGDEIYAGSGHGQWVSGIYRSDYNAS